MADSDNNLEQQEEKIDCTITVEESGPWKKKISVQIPRDQIDKELNSQYGQICKSAEVPGFRKGRAPRRLVEKRFGEDVSNQTKLRLLAQAFEKIDEEQDFEILGEPDFDPEKIELPQSGDLDFDYEVEVKPVFDLPSLEGIKIEKHLIEVTDDRINEAIEDLRRRSGQLEDVDQAQEKDMVFADVTMKVEGLEESQKAENIMLPVRPTSVMGVWVEDMGQVLDQVKVDQKLSCSAKVGDTHGKEQYRGKLAQFDIEVRSIQRIVPAGNLDQEFFTSIGVENEDELRRVVEENLENQVDREIRGQMVRQVYKYLEENIVFELPEGVAARYSQRILTRRHYELQSQGIPQDKIEENMEKLRTSSSEQAARELKMSFIMERLADKLGIEVSESEVNGYIARMAMQQQRRPERLRDELQREKRLDMLKNQIQEEKAVDRILEMAQIVDAPEVKKEPAPEKPKKKTKKVTKKSAVTSAEKSAEKKTDKKNSRKEVKRKPPSTD